MSQACRGGVDTVTVGGRPARRVEPPGRRLARPPSDAVRRRWAPPILTARRSRHPGGSARPHTRLSRSRGTWTAVAGAPLTALGTDRRHLLRETVRQAAPTPVAPDVAPLADVCRRDTRPV